MTEPSMVRLLARLRDLRLTDAETRLLLAWFAAHDPAAFTVLLDVLEQRRLRLVR